MGDLFSGQNVVLEYNTGDEVTPDWHEVGQQVNGSLSIDSATANVTVKNNNGWTVTIPTVNSWSMELECRLDLADAGLLYLENCIMNRILASIRFRMKKAPTRAWRGRATVSSYKPSFPSDDAIGLAISFGGYGQLLFETPAAV